MQEQVKLPRNWQEGKQGEVEERKKGRNPKSMSFNQFLHN